MKRLLLPLLAFICIATTFVPKSQAQTKAWGTDGTAATGTLAYNFANQCEGYVIGYYECYFNTSVDNDGTGGMVTAWCEYSYDYYVHVQRIGANGSVTWSGVNGGNGALAYSYNYTDFHYVTVKGDGRGGAYVCYVGYNPNNGRYAPYIQYVDPAGICRWGVNAYSTYTLGYNLAPQSGSEYSQIGYPYYPSMDRDGQGGVVICYYNYTSTSQYGNLYVSRITETNTTDATPTFNWGPRTLFTGNSTEYFYYAYTSGSSSYYSNPHICSDGAKGCFVAWATYYNTYAVRVAHYDDNGSLTSNNAVKVPYYLYNGGYGNGSSYNPMPLHVMNDHAGGAIVAYGCYYSYYAYSPIYAFRVPTNVVVNGAGAFTTPSWGPKLVSRYMYYNKYPDVAADSAAGFWLTYQDNYSSGQYVLRHFDGSGNVTSDQLLGGYISYSGSSVTTDQKGNAMVVWGSSNSYYMVMAQKYSLSSGSSMWPSNIQISNNTNTNYSYYSFPCISNDGQGGALIGRLVYYDGSKYYSWWGQRIADTAALPHAAVSAKSYSYPTGLRVGAAAVQIGTSSAPTFTVNSANGSAPLTQSALVVSSVTSLPKGPSPLLPVGTGATFVGMYNTTTFATVPLGTPLAAGTKVGVVYTLKAPSNLPFMDSLIFATNDPNNSRLAFGAGGFGVYPHLTANGNLNMPKTVRSVPYSTTFQVNNTGTSDLNITRVTVTTGDATSYSISGGQSGTPQDQTFTPTKQILAGSQGFITVNFTPNSADPKLSQFNVYSEDSASPKVVTLAGTGVFPHITALQQVNFLNTVINLRSSKSTWSVKNSGTSDLVITGANFTNPEFTVDSPATFPVTPITVTAGSTSIMKVKFTPVGSTFGQHTGIMNIVSNFDSVGGVFPVNQFPVNLGGVAVDGAPDMQCASFIDLGALHVGKKDTVSYHILNSTDGTKPLVIYSFNVIGQYAKDFAIVSAPATPVTIPIGSAIDLKISYVALENQQVNAVLDMSTSAGAYPVDIPMLGRGVKAQLTATDLDFGKVATNTCKTLDLQVSNTGNDNLTISGFTLIGAHALLYSYPGPTNLTLTPNDTKIIHLKFCPTLKESDDIQVRYITSDGDTVIANVHGRGGAAGALEGQNINFKLVQINQTVSQPEHFLNTGDIPVTIATAVFLNTVAPNPFSTDIALPATIQPGATLNFNVMFNSSTGGDKSADMKFTADDGYGITLHVNGSATPDPFDAAPRLLFDTVVDMGHNLLDHIYIANFTKDARTVSALDITGPGASAYGIMYPITWPYDISAQNLDSVVVRFAPKVTTQPQTYLATLVVSLSSGDTVRIALTGRSQVTLDVKTNEPIPNVFSLTQNYPNPFAGTTTFSYSIPEHGDVTMTIYDVMGREVRELLNGTRDAGVYTMDLSGETLPAGTYTYALRVNGITKSRLMQVVK